MDNPKVEANELELLNYYKQNYKTKICREIRFEDSLDERQKKLYKKFQSSCCCIRPLSLLIYSIFIFAFTFVGFLLSISKNKGYKAYKEVLERNMSLINNDLPHEHETIKLINYLTRNKTEDYYICNYLFYILDLCSIEKYRLYCTFNKYTEKKCNNMDYQYYLGNTYECTLDKYEAGFCSQIQYNAYLEKTSQISYEPKINYTYYNARIHLQSFTFEKIWLKIGDYDQPIYLSFLILMVIFFVLLIFDLILNKKIIMPNAKYYILISLYMIYHVIFRIYTVLFLILSYYGVFVSFINTKIISDPDDNGSFYVDPFLDNSVKIYNSEDKLWKDKRLYALIFCGISFVLFILVWILSCYKKLIYNYLSFNFDERNMDNNQENLSEIVRCAEINVGKNKYNFEIKQNKELYLKENRNNKKHYFKEIIFENNIYYLKCNNLSLRTQLGWSEFKYPNANF